MGMIVQVKLLRSILGDKAPQCPKLDISVDVWETVLHLILGDSKDKDGKWGLGYDAVFNPYNDDVSFMAGALCCPGMACLMTGAFEWLSSRACLTQAHVQQYRLGLHIIAQWRALPCTLLGQYRSQGCRVSPARLVPFLIRGGPRVDAHAEDSALRVQLCSCLRTWV